MVPYIGNGAYCYANSTSILLASQGENISPSLIEVLTGVGLGAMWVERGDHLPYFSSRAGMPDKGISQALRILGFEFEENYKSDKAEPPIRQLKHVLNQSPVVLGPLDMGYLQYNPNYKNLFEVDHYVLAYATDDEYIYVQDPAGFPFAQLSHELLEQAWRAENVFYRTKRYRYWTSPVRISSPTVDEIYEKATASFKRIYKESQDDAAREDKLYGKQAIIALADCIKDGEASTHLIGHLSYFVFSVGSRRAGDYADFFRPFNYQLHQLKLKQGKLFGKCQLNITQHNFQNVSDTLRELADVEHEFYQEMLK
ncbi:BtrH N-terminal domain-containing protein [Paenibacillus tarimensis]